HPIHVIRICPDEAAYRTGSRRARCLRSRLLSNRRSRVAPVRNRVASQRSAAIAKCDHQREEAQRRCYIDCVGHDGVCQPLLGSGSVRKRLGQLHSGRYVRCRAGRTMTRDRGTKIVQSRCKAWLVRPRPAGPVAVKRQCCRLHVVPRSAVIIEDDPPIRRVLRHALESDFDRVLEAGTAAAGIDLVASEQPALVVLDLGLPDAEGVEVCRELRAWCVAPILILSARHSESEKVTLLDAGADDYITKPFSTVELQARVRALLRRASVGNAPSLRIEFGPYVMDLAGRTLRRNGEIVHLTPIEWELLRTLAVNA